MNLSNLNNNEVYLAKWLDGKITDVELQSLVPEEDFKAYVKIKDSLEFFEAPIFEFDKLKQNIEKKINPKDPKIRTLSYKWLYAAAAMLAIIITTYFYNNTKTVYYIAKTGEKQSIELLDGSKVRINANSSLSFSNKIWKKERTLNLKGEAFFKVRKGKKFTVKTDNGVISVLGTQFNINSRENFIKVTCYSGRVRVIQRKDTIYLTKGKAFQFNGLKTEKWNFSADKPAWLKNEALFKSTPLKIVINSLENQFGIEIRSDKIDENQIYTGSFTYNDLDIALKSVFLPMNISYKIDNKIVFLSKK